MRQLLQRIRVLRVIVVGVAALTLSLLGFFSSALRAPRPTVGRLVYPLEGPAPSPELQRLAAQKVTVRFSETPIMEALAEMQRWTQAKVIVTNYARDLISSEDIRVSAHFVGVSALSAFRFIATEYNPDLALAELEGAVLIDSAHREDETELRCYSVRDILDIEEPYYKASLLTPEEIEAAGTCVLGEGLVEKLWRWSRIEPESSSVVDICKGVLIVRASRRSHARLTALLDALRWARSDPRASSQDPRFRPYERRPWMAELDRRLKETRLSVPGQRWSPFSAVIGHAPS